MTQTTKHEDDLELKDLNQYTGTQQYFNVLGFNVTDGVAYIMQNGYSWFVTDSLAVIRHDSKVKNQEFLSIKLKLLADNKAQIKAQMLITDGNNKELYTQDYTYTNAKKELQLYFTNGVLLLAREY